MRIIWICGQILWWMKSCFFFLIHIHTSPVVALIDSKLMSTFIGSHYSLPVFDLNSMFCSSIPVRVQATTTLQAYSSIGRLTIFHSWCFVGWCIVWLVYLLQGVRNISTGNFVSPSDKVTINKIINYTILYLFRKKGTNFWFRIQKIVIVKNLNDFLLDKMFIIWHFIFIVLKKK